MTTPTSGTIRCSQTRSKFFITSELTNWIAIHFFFNDTATTEIYTLSLHDALQIFRECVREERERGRTILLSSHILSEAEALCEDRKSTRLNSSHITISYAVFC